MRTISTPIRVAIIADIHGNSLALDAVLADIEAQGGVDDTWFLGDYVAIGPDPLGVMDRLAAFPEATFIRGNTDRLTVDMQVPWPVTAEELAEPGFWELYGRINRSFGWTAGAITTAGWRPWLAALPVEARFTLPDGTRVLLVHASPGTDDGTGLHPFQSDDERRKLLAGAQADLLFIGHTHLPLDFTLEETRVVNPGSVGNPLPPDLRANYALLVANESGYQVSLHEVDYDREAVMALAAAVNHPAYDYIRDFLVGERQPGWMEDEVKPD